MKNIIFIAPPAAGKGTMSEILIDKYGYKHISTGDILRSMAKSEDEFGKELSDLLKRGELVPDAVVYEAVKRRLSEKDLDNGFILDGFPRNIEQAKEYDKILSEINRDLGVVIYLDTPRDVLEKRITGRRICSDCGATYNVLTGVNKPVIEDICDKCGSELYQREDDNLEAFDNRYDTFIKKTYPLVEFYENKKVLYRVKSIDIDSTMKEIEAIIND